MVQKSVSHNWANARNVLFAVAAIAMPTLISLGYYYMSGNPAFSPLSITGEGLIEQGEVVKTHELIYGIVTNDGTKEHEAQALYFSEMLIAAFRSKGVKAKVNPVFREGSHSMDIYFFIDGKRIGPYNQSNVPDGLELAVETFTMAWEEEYGPHHRDW